MLTSSIDTALSSIALIEQKMGVASSNIANANVKGYTQKTVTQQTEVVGGVGVGVLSTGVTSAANQYLQKGIIDATASSAKASTDYTYLSQLDQILGSLSNSTGSSTSGSGLSSSLSTLYADLSALSTTPDSTGAKQQVVSDLNSLAVLFQQTSSSIQGLRTSADQQITSDIASANSALATISAMNTAIAQAKAGGQPTVDLADKQASAIQTLSAYINVSYYTDSTGAAHVYSGSTTLIDGPTYNTLSHVSASSLSSSTSYNTALTGGVTAILAGGSDVTGNITGGSLGALINQRDTVMPNAQSELDTLASTLSLAVNNVSNTGTASSNTQTLTGNVTVTTGTGVTVGAGTVVRVAQLNADGTFNKYADISLTSGASTVSALVTAINAQTATSGVTAAVNANGYLTLSASSSSYGVALATKSGSVSVTGGVSGTATDLSSAFGLNDLLINGTSSSTIAVRSDILTSPTLLPTGKLSTGTVTLNTTKGIISGDATVSNNLVSALTTNQTFAASGNLAAGSKTLLGYSQAIVSGLANQVNAAKAQSDTAGTLTNTLVTQYSNLAGVNVDQETSTLSQLQSMYSTSAQILSVEKTMFAALLSAVQTS